MLRRSMLMGLVSLPFLAACASGGSKDTGKSTGPGHQDIIGTLAANKDFTKLLAAIKSAGLTNMLASGGPYTLFAPNDKAFGELSQRDKTRLARPQNKDELERLIRYHVFPGLVTSPDLHKNRTLRNIDGDIVQIARQGMVLSLRTANIIKYDLRATNGRIHVINQVLIPPKR